MGGGTFAVLIFAVLGLLICCVKDTSHYPNCLVCAGFLLPIFVLLIIVGLPKESYETSEAAKTTVKPPTSPYFVRSIAFLFFNIMAAIMTCIFVICFKCRRVSVQRFDTNLADNTGPSYDDDSDDDVENDPKDNKN